MARRFPSRWSSASKSSLPHTARSATATSSPVRQIRRGIDAVQPDAKATFGCLWLRDFPAWAAMRAEPSLQGHPVVIHRLERILALSPEARKLGVEAGWTLARVHSRCPQVLAVPHDPAACTWAWQQIMEAVYQFTPRVEAKSEGMLFLEVPHHKSRLIELCKLVFKWQARCGIATDRATAELAALSALRRSTRHIRTGAERGFLNSVPVALLTQAGISAQTVERLLWFGLNSLSDLQVLTREHLTAQFESREAKRLWYFARAGSLHAERSPVLTYRPAPTIEERIVFDTPATGPQEWEGAVELLAGRAAERLHGMGTSLLSVAVETQNGRRPQSRLMREPISSSRILTRFLGEMVAHCIGLGEHVEAIEVRLGQLSATSVQSTLFAETEKPRGICQTDRSRELLQHLRNVEARFSQTMWKLRLRDAYAPLPEERYSLVPALGEDASGLS